MLGPLPLLTLHSLPASLLPFAAFPCTYIACHLLPARAFVNIFHRPLHFSAYIVHRVFCVHARLQVHSTHLDRYPRPMSLSEFLCITVLRLKPVTFCQHACFCHNGTAGLWLTWHCLTAQAPGLEAIHSHESPIQVANSVQLLRKSSVCVHVFEALLRRLPLPTIPPHKCSSRTGTYQRQSTS